jgi:hypothetical protein
MAPITGFFGANSSGKTGILQLLLLIKQTIESTDRSRVLHPGDEYSYVDLGTFFDLLHSHTLPGQLVLETSWSLIPPLSIDDPESGPKRELFALPNLSFVTKIGIDNHHVGVDEFTYSFFQSNQSYRFGMKLMEAAKRTEGEAKYELLIDGYEAKRTRGRGWPLPNPVKCYGFPDQVNAYYQNIGFLSEFVLAFEQLFQNVFYLGPLREYPHRSYIWAGSPPEGVGSRGQNTIPALLAAREQGKMISRGKGRKRQTVDERVADWLRKLDLIDSFVLRTIAPNRKEFEVRVKRFASSSEVSLTDVGFGVSQILPVLTLCYYAPEGSTIILEQPEIHLHPSVQAGLADVFIDVVKTRNLQVIVESHSEHLLRRLQRRIAEEKLPPEKMALYFIVMEASASKIEALSLDAYGNISNWPKNFFGDEFGELAAMTEAAMVRQLNSGKKRA